MMRSLFSGVAGLKTHQTKMDVIGNNIANVNTTSFKSQSITFSDLMYQTTQAASGPTQTKGGTNARQIGLGAKSGAIATAIEGQGSTQTTNNPFDIMITGKSFFVVNNGQENMYTRDGSFYVDGAGNLAMQSNGYLVMGWAAKVNKETGAREIDTNSGLTSLEIMTADNSTYAPASTTSALFKGNIDSKDPNILSDDGKTIQLEFYDNKGYLYTAKFAVREGTGSHQFTVQLKDIIDSSGKSMDTTLFNKIQFGGEQDSPVAAKEMLATGGYTAAASGTDSVQVTNTAGEDYTFKYQGTLADLKTANSTTGDTTKTGIDFIKSVYGVDISSYDNSYTYSINPVNGNLVITGKIDKAIVLEFDAATGNLTKAAGDEKGLVKMVFDPTVVGFEAFGYQTYDGDNTGKTPGQIEMDFSTVTNYNTNGASTLKANKGDKKSLNTGRAVGEMNGVTVSTDGKINATYSNGQTKLLGQIASAEFANASGLSKEGDNLYKSTLNSGEATVQDITTDGGYMNTGVLEMSNVDLSSEFTSMITTQRGFQANSRIITVSDTLLEELTNLKR